MKHKHILTFNQLQKRSTEYIYEYGNTKNIIIKICPKGFQIITELSKRFDAKEMISGNTNLFADAIRKAWLIYLLTYSKGLKISSISVRIDDEEDLEVFSHDSEPTIYSMINADLKRQLPEAYANEPVINYVLHTTKSDYGKRKHLCLHY